MQVNGISGEQSYRPAEAKEAAEAVDRPGAEKTPEQKTEQTTVNTDQVDREIERLKQKKQALEQQLRTAQNEQQREALERELQMIESALSFKDNDTYRKQNAIMV
ncbi:MAG: hypothetical protein IJP92_12055 [Lachnospiraceae bacterium]|nr:hypothetical protein [Lachnospiraceae bacterium]